MRRITELKITLLNGDRSFYSTHDRIQGHVSFQFEDDTVIDDLSISLEGKASIRVEKHVLLSDKAGYTYGDQTFLRMPHPVQASDLPDNRLARGRKTYSIPFSFTVPESMLPYACTHSVKGGNTVRKAHLLLPPSLGTSQTHHVFADDISSDRVKVAYNIQVRVRKRFPHARAITIMRARPVCIVPMRDEVPPMFIEEKDSHYRLTQEKTVHQGIPAITRSIGRLIVSAPELPALVLPHPNDDLANMSTRKVPIDLLFRSNSPGDQPPTVYMVSVKLLTFTFFGALPYKIIPRPDNSHENHAEYSHYLSTTRLGSYALKNIQWVHHESRATATKLTSKFKQPSSNSVGAPRANQDDRSACRAAQIQVPIQLPKSIRKPSKRKLLTPTFSSCLVSRTYSLELKISYQAASSNATEASHTGNASSSLARCLTPRSHMVLRLPLQVRVDPGCSDLNSAEVSQSISLASCGHQSSQYDKMLGSINMEEQPPQYTIVSLP